MLALALCECDASFKQGPARDGQASTGTEESEKIVLCKDRAERAVRENDRIETLAR